MERTFTKYERARILGARALQLSMDAPVLINVDEKLLSNLNFDPLKIAETEFNSGVLPITVNRPLPKKSKDEIEKVKIEVPAQESEEKKAIQEKEEEKEIVEEGEIMELANPEDEIEEVAETGAEEEI